MSEVPCVICKKVPTDRAHIKSKGSGGTMDEWNLLSFCRLHHIEQHKSGWTKLAQKYPQVQMELECKGWRFINHFGLTKLVRSV